MVMCGVFGCGKRTVRDVGISFYRFPRVITCRGKKVEEITKKRRELWLCRVNRADLTEEKMKYSRVCCLHFIKRKPADLYDVANPDWAPSVALGYEFNLADEIPFRADLDIPLPSVISDNIYRAETNIRIENVSSVSVPADSSLNAPNLRSNHLLRFINLNHIPSLLVPSKSPVSSEDFKPKIVNVEDVSNGLLSFTSSVNSEALKLQFGYAENISTDLLPIKSSVNSQDVKPNFINIKHDSFSILPVISSVNCHDKLQVTGIDAQEEKGEDSVVANNNEIGNVTQSKRNSSHLKDTSSCSDIGDKNGDPEDIEEGRSHKKRKTESPSSSESTMDAPEKMSAQSFYDREDIFGQYVASEMRALRDNPLLYLQTKQSILEILTSANFELINPE